MGDPAGLAAHPADPSTTGSAYWERLSAGDRRGALAVALGAVDAGASIAHVLIEVVCPAQLEVGRRWASGEWNVAEEHAATAISEEVVAALAVRAPERAERGVAVVGCVDGEWHALPARVLAEVLRLDGWRVTYLGASVPARHLAQHLHDTGPDVVALSCSVATALPRARLAIEAVRGAGVPVVVGGAGFGADGTWARLLGANGWAPDADAAVRLLGAPDWPTYTDPAPAHTQPDGESDDVRRAAPAVEAAVEHAVDVAPEAVRQVLDFLVAALYVDDVTLLTDAVGWLSDVARPRGIPDTDIVAILDCVAGALAHLPRAARFVDAAVRSLDAPSGRADSTALG